jgi:hypothetical protein
VPHIQSRQANSVYHEAPIISNEDQKIDTRPDVYNIGLNRLWQQSLATNGFDDLSTNFDVDSTEDSNGNSDG